MRSLLFCDAGNVSASLDQTVPGRPRFLERFSTSLPRLSGEVRWGTKVQIGYYAQQLDDLDDRNEIIMELRRVAPSRLLRVSCVRFWRSFYLLATMFTSTFAIFQVAKGTARAREADLFSRECPGARRAD